LYQIGDEITIEPTDLVAGGAAIARVDGFPVFATNVFPGDVARVRLHEVKKGYAKGTLVELVRPSAWRRAEPCPIANECGGCDWTALRLDKQLEAKRRILVESLRRIGKIDPATLPEIVLHPSPLNYRLRSRLHRDGDAVGFFAMQSHRVVPLSPQCEVVGLKTREHPIEGESWEVDGRVITDGELTIDGYQLATGAFFQVNRHLLCTMLDLLHGLASRTKAKRSAIDLYAGVGFFTVPLAKEFERVTSVEGAQLAHEYAKRNVPPNVRVVRAAIEDYVTRMTRADLVFLDPPRTGAQRNVIDAIAAKTNERICFLACDPVTFARDASRLIASGWRLSTLDLLDLFPNTHHVETLSSFERAQPVS
jgi:tRNA/tmRNA/rRNA uracil-C5-methylase (TrmA/RlmC/RlmD family)